MSRGRIIYTATTGSHLHRTNNEHSDTDIRSVYVLRRDDRVSPFGFQKTFDEDEHVGYEVTHFAMMLSKNNPTAMEIAWSDLSDGFNDELVYVIREMAYSALDTVKYVKSCNGMIQGLLNERQQTPKRLHHAARMLGHLEIYIHTGHLIYDTRLYVDYERLLRIKRGEEGVDNIDFSKREPKTIHHTANLPKLEWRSATFYDDEHQIKYLGKDGMYADGLWRL